MSAQKLNKADIVTDFRRAQVIAAARERFSKHGLAGTTMDGIAQAAGVAKGTVYLYFRSKDDLLIAIFEKTMASAIVEGRQALASLTDPEARLRRIARLHLARLGADRDLAGGEQTSAWHRCICEIETPPIGFRGACTHDSLPSDGTEPAGPRPIWGRAARTRRNRGWGASRSTCGSPAPVGPYTSRATRRTPSGFW